MEFNSYCNRGKQRSENDEVGNLMGWLLSHESILDITKNKFREGFCNEGKIWRRLHHHLQCSREKGEVT
jgi:hypothetical protein